MPLCCVTLPALLGAALEARFLALQTPSNLPPVRRRVGQQKDAQKSRIGNGALLPGVDQRNGWVRRAKELLAAHVADLGGDAAVSTAEHSIVRRRGAHRRARTAATTLRLGG